MGIDRRTSNRSLRDHWWPSLPERSSSQWTALPRFDRSGLRWYVESLPLVPRQGLSDVYEQPLPIQAALSSHAVQGYRYRPDESFHQSSWCRYSRRSKRRSQQWHEQRRASVMSWVVTNDWVTSKGPLDPLSEVDPAEHPLSIRSLYVLLVVVLSAWVLGAALRLTAELAGWWVR